MANSRLIRAGPRWFEMEEEFRRQGLRFSRSELTDSVGRFIKEENFIPLLVNRAKKRRGLF
jgi:hypothetical protein